MVMQLNYPPGLGENEAFFLKPGLSHLAVRPPKLFNQCIVSQWFELVVNFKLRSLVITSRQTLSVSERLSDSYLAAIPVVRLMRGILTYASP
jgi:hypothetical protein